MHNSLRRCIKFILFQMFFMLWDYWGLKTPKRCVFRRRKTPILREILYETIFHNDTAVNNFGDLTVIGAARWENDRGAIFSVDQVDLLPGILSLNTDFPVREPNIKKVFLDVE